MKNTGNNRPSLIVNWIARGLGLIVVVVFLTFVIGDTVDVMQQGNSFDIESLKIILPLAVGLAGYILAWWHKIIGGSLLILVAITFGVLMSLVSQSNPGPESNFHAFTGWLILGLPFFITGVLFLTSAWLDRKIKD